MQAATTNARSVIDVNVIDLFFCFFERNRSNDHSHMVESHCSYSKNRIR